MKPAIRDVAVVGGGVVGAALALDLQRRGLSVVLVERGRAPQAFNPAAYDLRVYALAPAAVSYLDELGLWTAIRERRVCAYESMRVWDETSAQALEFDAASVRAARLGYIVENDLLTATLWDALHGVELRCGSGVERFELAADHALLGLSDGTELRARLVVAADGADSALRAMAGIETSGWPYPHKALVCHVRTGKPHEARCYQRFLPTGPLAFLPLADGRCSIVWSTTEADELLALDDAAFNERLGEALQHELGRVTQCTARVSFPLRLLHARNYVGERLALAGDAAHVVHPLAGQGVNLGLADAQQLAPLLSQAREQRRDLGRLRLLKRYERARQADNLDMLALTDALYRMFEARGDSWNELRRYGMGAVNRLAPLKEFFAARASGS